MNNEDGKKRIIPVNWSIQKKDLSRFSYPVLEGIFYGINNLSVPVEIMDWENPDEIVANYVAAGILKGGNKHLKGNLPRNFSDLIQSMNRVAYGPSFGDVGNFKQRFSRKPGMQRERLSEMVGPEAQEQFVESFFSDYISSNREQPNNPESFYDPNCDGRNRGVYVGNIFKHLKRKFERATESREGHIVVPQKFLL